MSFVPAVSTPRIIAHRGASAEKPENTLPAFRRAIARRADGIELDVQVTRDGVPVVFHDDDLRRLTGVRGDLAALTWTELRRLRVAGRERIPRLAEVLRTVRGRIPVQVEMKAGASVPEVVAAVRAGGGKDAVILASFSVSLVAEAKRCAPEIPRMIITEGRRPKAWLAAQLRRTGAAGLSVNHRSIRTAAWVRYFHERGWTVWSWTVNDAATARRLAEAGVDALIGDDPALLRRALSLS